MDSGTNTGLTKTFRSRNGDQGLVETLVFLEFARDKRATKTEFLLLIYRMLGCEGVCSLILAIEKQGPDYLWGISFEIGEEEFWLNIGYPHMHPLVWFSCLARRIDELSEDQKQLFDNVCASLVPKVESREITVHGVLLPH